MCNILSTPGRILQRTPITYLNVYNFSCFKTGLIFAANAYNVFKRVCFLQFLLLQRIFAYFYLFLRFITLIKPQIRFYLLQGFYCNVNLWELFSAEKHYNILLRGFHEMKKRIQRTPVAYVFWVFCLFIRLVIRAEKAYNVFFTDIPLTSKNACNVLKRKIRKINKDQQNHR